MKTNWDTELKIAKAKSLRLVYGTRSEQWHTINATDRDWNTAITPEQANAGEAKCMSQYLSSVRF